MLKYNLKEFNFTFNFDYLLAFKDTILFMNN